MSVHYFQTVKAAQHCYQIIQITKINLVLTQVIYFRYRFLDINHGKCCVRYLENCAWIVL